VNTVLSGARVVRVLTRLRTGRGSSAEVVIDSRPEPTSQILDQWAVSHRDTLSFVEPSRPEQNAFIGDFTGRFRGLFDAEPGESLCQNHRALLDALSAQNSGGASAFLRNDNRESRQFVLFAITKSPNLESATLTF
jgi:hypothetical protein